MKVPTDIVLHTKTRELELTYEDGTVARLSYEFCVFILPLQKLLDMAQGKTSCKWVKSM